MDDGAIAHVEINLNNNLNVLQTAKTDKNGNLTDSFNSLPLSKSRTSSIGSEYELVSDEAVECFENECIGETVGHPDQSQNNEIKELDSARSVENSQVDDPSDTSSAMDEEFVIVDDDVIEEIQSCESSDENLGSTNDDANLGSTNDNTSPGSINDAENLASINDAGDLDSINDAENLDSINGAENLASTNDAENLTSTSDAEDLASTNDAENLAITNDAENLASINLGENEADTNLDENEAHKYLDENEAHKYIDKNEAHKYLDENEAGTNLDENEASTNLDENLACTNDGENEADTNLDENLACTNNDENEADTNHDENMECTNNNVNEADTNLDENMTCTNDDKNEADTNLDENMACTNDDENEADTNFDENMACTNDDENEAGTNLDENMACTNDAENEADTNLDENMACTNNDENEADENMTNTNDDRNEADTNFNESEENTINDNNKPSTNNDEYQANASNDYNNPSTAVEKQLLSDDDFEMDEIIAEFAEEEKKKNSVVKLSDGEDEIDSLLDEFVETQTISKTDSNLILSSDDEDGMECLLEEFSMENLSDDDSSSQKGNCGNNLAPISVNNVYNSTMITSNASAESGGSIELTVTSSKINNSSIDENDCVIVCDDDKSDCSSVEIITEDDIVDKKNDVPTNQDTEKNSLSGFTSKEAAPSSELVSEQKLNFEDMVFVDEVQDTSDTDIRKFISDSEHFHPDSPNHSASAYDSASGVTSNINISNIVSTDPSNHGNSTLHISSNINISSVTSSDPANPDNSTSNVTSSMDISCVETSKSVSPSTSNLDVASKMDISSVNSNDSAFLGNITSHKPSKIVNSSVESCGSLGNSTSQITPKMDVSSVEFVDTVSPGNSTLKIISEKDISNAEPNDSKSNTNLTVEANSDCLLNCKKVSDEPLNVVKNAEGMYNELESETAELNCHNKDLSVVSEETSKSLDVANSPRTSDETLILFRSSSSNLVGETVLNSLTAQKDSLKQVEIATEPNEAVKDKTENVYISDSVTEINPIVSEKAYFADAVATDVTNTSSIILENNIDNKLSLISSKSSYANDKTGVIQNSEQLMEQNGPTNDENCKNIEKKSNTDANQPRKQPEGEKHSVYNIEGDDEILIDIDETTTKTEESTNEHSSVFKGSSEYSIPNSRLPIATTKLHPVSDEVKKRKLEDADNETDIKKQKQENISSSLLNGDESSASDASSDFALRNSKIEDLVSEVSVADCKVIEKASQFLPLDPSLKIRASKKVFQQISLYICHQVTTECFKKPLENAQKEKDELKRKIEILSKSLESFRSQANDFHNSQKKSFAEYSFKPKAHTRTVGVNVKIYRESEIKHAITMQQNNANNKPLNIGEHLTYKQETKSQPPLSKTEVASTKPEIKPFAATTTNVTPTVNAVSTVNVIPTTNVISTTNVTPIANVVPNANVRDSVPSNVSPSAPQPPFQNSSVYVPCTQIKESVLSSVTSSHLIRRQLLPRIVAQTNRPVLGPQAVVGLANRPPPPNVTMSGNRLMSIPNTQRPGAPNTRSVVLVPSTTVTSQARSNQFMTTIDLTKDERKMNPALVPIRDYLQLLPSGARSSAVSVQSSQMPRPTLVPPLPTSLLGTRTVTYILPANSTVGGRGGIPSFLPQSNQPVQLVFRMTNSGGMPTLGTVVNSVSRMPGGGHHVFNPSAPRMSTMQTVNSSQPRMMGLPQPPFSNAVPRLAGTSHPSFSTPAPRMAGMSQQLANAPSRSSSGLILFSHAPKSQSAGIDNRIRAGGNKDITRRHPAPFPKSPEYPDNKTKSIPPKPLLKGNKNPNGGIVLSWNMCLMKHHAGIQSYQLFAYQETDGPVDASLWKKVGDVNALPLPMACTLTQFIDKNRYFFTVRAIDVFSRAGPYSDPVSILYDKEADTGLKK